MERIGTYIVANFLAYSLITLELTTLLNLHIHLLRIRVITSSLTRYIGLLVCFAYTYTSDFFHAIYLQNLRLPWLQIYTLLSRGRLRYILGF